MSWEVNIYNTIVVNENLNRLKMIGAYVRTFLIDTGNKTGIIPD